MWAQTLILILQGKTKSRSVTWTKFANKGSARKKSRVNPPHGDPQSDPQSDPQGESLSPLSSPGVTPTNKTPPPHDMATPATPTATTFQDEDKLYFVLSYAAHGELLPYIQRVGAFDEETTQFYSAEMVAALHHLHSIGVIHRDLKPENILLDEHMHIKITDFGSAKILHTSEQPPSQEVVRPERTGDGGGGGGGGEGAPGGGRRHSFVGTAQYVSPELLTNKSCSVSTDLWALGCIIYQCLAGLTPFRAGNEYLIFQKVVKLEYDFPDGFSNVGRDLVERLLVVEPDDRLGSDKTGGYPALKSHRFYSGVRWDTLHLQTPPRILPYLPAKGSSSELRSTYEVPDDLPPGLDDKQMTRLLGLFPVGTATEESHNRRGTILDISPSERTQRLKTQAENNIFHRFVENNLILKQGLMDKRVGLFARRRMFLLTEGPHLYYVDPVNMVLKGQIPWSADMRTENKNFKIFFVHTPKRTYYLEEPEGYALEWCRVLDEVRLATYGSIKDLS